MKHRIVVEVETNEFADFVAVYSGFQAEADALSGNGVEISLHAVRELG